MEGGLTQNIFIHECRWVNRSFNEDVIDIFSLKKILSIINNENLYALSLVVFLGKNQQGY